MLTTLQVVSPVLKTSLCWVLYRTSVPLNCSDWMPPSSYDRGRNMLVRSVVRPFRWTSLAQLGQWGPPCSTSTLKSASVHRLNSDPMACVLQVDFAKPPLLNSRGVDSSVINADASMPSFLGENNRSAPPDGRINLFAKFSWIYSRRAWPVTTGKGKMVIFLRMAR
jgi:hypothetical protein